MTLQSTIISIENGKESNCYIYKGYGCHFDGVRKTSRLFSKTILKLSFLGFVDNLYETMKGSVMIVPITIGSGIRMKILEAASMGVPFVSTTVGAEGIPVKDGNNCFLADDPKAFVADILKLQDKNLKLRFIQNANQMVKQQFLLKL